MKSKRSFWQRIGLHDWFLKSEVRDTDEARVVTPDDIYKYIIQKFYESIGQLSFADRVVFYHEYIIAFSPGDYIEFMDNKKGIFGLIVQESLKKFYEVLKHYRAEGKTVEPSSSKWVFRFVSNPDYGPGDKGFMGKLLPGNFKKEENLRVTFIPRQTGIAESSDITPEILKGFTFYSEGYYEVPYQETLVYDERKVNNSIHGLLARFEAILPDKAYAGKKIEYMMKDDEITVSGKDDQSKEQDIFRIPSEWVNSPHLKIRYSRNDSKFFLASFGEKTMLNEKQILASDLQHPVWSELPINSKIVLNGIVGVNIFKS